MVDCCPSSLLKAIFVTKINHLHHANKGYSRLYYGNEFCEHLLPSLEELKQALDFALARKIQFTLVTPFLTDGGLAKLEPLLSYLKKNHPMSEIVANDWGLLHKLSSQFRFGGLILGRILVKQYRDPCFKKLRYRIKKRASNFFKTSNIDFSYDRMVSFLSAKGISRIELDNLMQGIIRKTSLKASLYFPYGYVAPTRYCPTALIAQKIKSVRVIPICSKECQGHTFRLIHPFVPKDLLLKGNTIFFKNEALPRSLEKMSIDRLVFEPEIPI